MEKRLEHMDAVRLEHLVKDTCNLENGESMGGLVSADRFAEHPLEAAMLCIAYKYDSRYEAKIDEFIDVWRSAFQYPDEAQEYTAERYIAELKELVQAMMYNHH